MKEVTIKFYFEDNIYIPNLHIKIYDVNNKLIYENNSLKENYINLNVKYGVYKVKMYLNSYLYNSFSSNVIIVKENICSKYKFCIKKIIRFHIVTLKIVDSFYKNMNLSKGELILWQKNM